jgi:predicted dehydrogenase
VVGLCDLIQEHLDSLGDELGVSARYTDLDAMIAETQPDIVAIPTGTEFHHELCMRVLEHGVNIEVEKPICVDLEQADEVVATAAEKGVCVAVHHQGRVSGNMRALSRALDEGRIGRLRYMQGSGKGYYGGYGLLNIGTHTLNSMIKFGGHCRSVVATALTDGHAITPEDVVHSPSGMGTMAGEYITATLHLEGNITANILHHRFPEGDSKGNVLELYGTEGRLMWSLDGAWRLPSPNFLPDGERDRWELLAPEYPDHFDPNGSADEADYGFVEEYVNALDEGREHECSGAQGRHVLEIIMGIFESAAYGRPVRLPQSRRDHPLVSWRQEHGLGDPAQMPRSVPEWLEAEDRRLGRR